MKLKIQFFSNFIHKSHDAIVLVSCPKTKESILIQQLKNKKNIAIFIIYFLVVFQLFIKNSYPAMYGYATNATGIYRIDTVTGSSTLVYNGAPFNGTTTVAGAAIRPSDGMLFFTFNNTANQPVYRWDPANPTVAPVLLGNTGATVPYIHRLTADINTDTIYGNDASPATTIWVINPTNGSATAVATISGIPNNTSGDIAFDPTSGNVYAPIQPNGSPTATVYQIPLAGGPVTAVGTITGLPTAGVLNSAMFNASGTLFIGGGSTYLWTAPVTGGPVTVVGDMGFTPQDYANLPVPHATPAVTKSFAPSNINVGGTSTLTINISSTYGYQLRGLTFTDTYPTGVVNANPPNATNTCGGTLTANAGAGSISLSGGTIPTNGSCTITVRVTSNTAGVYNNSIPVGGVQTAMAYNSSPATATLVVGNPLYIGGIVFEDINYGGGAGRNLTTSNGNRVPNARVELYSGAGNFITFTTTNSSGEYT
ncbi:MAG: hypothetical protein N2202_01305, partial [Proteobacteria bacterium]|nr:hypothetical protein [Pseudomonadota bacterium]